MATAKFTYKNHQAPTLFDGLQKASKEELSYLIALLRQQTMKNIFSDKFNNTVTTGKKAFNSVMSSLEKLIKPMMISTVKVKRIIKISTTKLKKRFAHYKVILKSNSIHYLLMRFARS